MIKLFTFRMMRKAKKTSTKSSRQLESRERRLSLYGKSGLERRNSTINEPFLMLEHSNASEFGSNAVKSLHFDYVCNINIVLVQCWD